MKKKIAISSDHAGYELKEYLKKNVIQVDWIDEGPKNSDRVDYPDFAEKSMNDIEQGRCKQAVLVCGSGIGMAIAANKFPGIRAVAAESELAARLSREHNDTNVLCLGARITPAKCAKSILETWLKTPFEGGRHNQRIEKISKIEARHCGIKNKKNRS